MACCIETTWYNGYRCGCCSHRRNYTQWVDSPYEALAEIPREFPKETEDGGYCAWKIRDGTTGKYVATSELSWPVNSPRGAGYRYTRWSLFIDGEVFPGHGIYSTQVIKGKNLEERDDIQICDMEGNVIPMDPKVTKPLEFITDKSWGELLDEIAEEKRLQDINKAESGR